MDILIFGAHPDDIELCCGGTVKKMTNSGHHVVIVDLTQGEMGTRGSVELRKKEAARASEILGVTERINLKLPDGGISNTQKQQQSVIRVIRDLQPHLCFITAPHDRHPDHTHATQLLTDAIYFAGLRKVSTRNGDGTPQKPWRPAHVLHYMQDRPFEPDLVMDISDTIESKIDAILAYGSQFNISEEEELQTYISSHRFFESIKGRARHFGHLIGVEFGEPFKYNGGPLPLRNFDLFAETSPPR